jgi:ribosomal-protein-alanine N-acetyltransferase
LLAQNGPFHLGLAVANLNSSSFLLSSIPFRSKPEPEIVVLRLSAASAADLERIDAECSRPPWSKELFLTEFSNPAALLLGARWQGQLLGFIDVHVVLDEAHVVNFGVAEKHRRQGIGECLVRAMLEHLFQHAVNWVTLEVRAGNSPARALYDRLGFVEAGVRAGYYSDNGEDALTMRLCVPSNPNTT